MFNTVCTNFNNNLSSAAEYYKSFVSNSADYTQPNDLVNDLTNCLTATTAGVVALQVLQVCIGGMWLIPLTAGAGYCGLIMCLDTSGEGRDTVNNFMKQFIPTTFLKQMGIEPPKAKTNAQGKNAISEAERNWNQRWEEADEDGFIKFKLLMEQAGRNFAANLSSLTAKANLDGSATDGQTLRDALCQCVQNVAIVTLTLFAMQWTAGLAQVLVVFGGLAYAGIAMSSNEEGRERLNKYVVSAGKCEVPTLFKMGLADLHKAFIG